MARVPNFWPTPLGSGRVLLHLDDVFEPMFRHELQQQDMLQELHERYQCHVRLRVVRGRYGIPGLFLKRPTGRNENKWNNQYSGRSRTTRRRLCKGPTLINNQKQGFSYRARGTAQMISWAEEGQCSSSPEIDALLSIVSHTTSKIAADFGTTSPFTPEGARREKKRVSIETRVQVRPTISRNDITPEECNATWYSKEEYSKITESCVKQIHKLNRGELLKGKKYCARGLEAHTNTRSLAKSMNRSLVYEAVLEEQDRQMRDGIVQDDALKRVYHAASSSSQLWAHVVGLQDQREADNIYDDTDEELSAYLR